MRLLSLTIGLSVLTLALGACSDSMRGLSAQPGKAYADRDGNGAATVSLPDQPDQKEAPALPGLENITVSEGSPVASDETAALLGLQPGIKPQGPSVAFRASGNVPLDTIDKIQFEIPFTGEPSDRLVVFCRLTGTDGEDIFGVIPNSYLKVNVQKKIVAFKPRGFGDYQAGFSEEAIVKPYTSENPKAKPAPEGILEVLGKISYANFYGLDALNNTAYLVGDPGLRVIDLTNPAAPLQVGALDSANSGSGSGRAVRIAGNLLIQSTDQGGYGTFDVTTPTSPTYGGGVTDQQGRDVAVVNTLGFAATSQGLRIFNQPSLALRILLGQTGGCTSVDADSRIAVATCGSLVLGVGVAGLPNTISVRTLEPVGGGRGVAIVNGYAYVAADEGLRIFDVLNPNQTTKVGSLALPGALQVAVSGNTAIVLTATAATAIDVTDKAAPKVFQLNPTLPITNGRRVKFLSPDRALILDATGLSFVVVHPDLQAAP